MANSIEFAKNYTGILDEVYQRAAVSRCLNSGGRMVRAGRNAKEILIPKISVTGLGDYTRNVGYKTGSITYEYETHSFGYDRAIRLFADVMDVEESGVLDCFVEAGAEFQRTSNPLKCYDASIGKANTRTQTHPRRTPMKHQCKVTVIDKKLFPDLQEQYLADPQSGPCPCFEIGQEYLFEREPGKDDFYHFGRELEPPFPCAEAWDAISRYIYTALAGGAIMKNWTNDERIMIACCNDGTRPVVFKLERIDVPETSEDEAWLASHDFRCSEDSAYTG